MDADEKKEADAVGGRFLRHALLLSAISLAMRALGILFNAAWVRATGSEALGLMSQIGGIFGFAVTLSASGIHLAVTRMVAEEEARGGGRTDAVMKAAGRFCLCTGGLSTLLLFLFSGAIGRSLLHDPRVIKVLRIMALSLPAGAISSCLGGYLTAVRQAPKNAAAQVIPQLCRMGVLCLWLLGTGTDLSAETACVLLAAVGTGAEWLGTALTGVLYYRFKSHNKPPQTEYPLVTSVLLRNALPLACSSCVRSGLLALEHVLIPLSLVAYGGTRAEALTSFGELQGMALPVILFPTALIASVAGLLIPEFAELGSVGRDSIPSVCDKVMRVTLLFSFAAAGLLGAFSTDLGSLLYGNANASRFILLLAPLVPVMYTDSIVDSMLKGLGQQVFSMNVNIADALLSVIAVTLLLPRFGVIGYVYVIYFSELFNFACSLGRLIAVTHWRPLLPRLLFRPLIATVVSTRTVGHLRRILFRDLPISVPGLLAEAGLTLMLFLLIAAPQIFCKKSLRNLQKGVAFSKSL